VVVVVVEEAPAGVLVDVVVDDVVEPVAAGAVGVGVARPRIVPKMASSTGISTAKV